MIFFFSSRRRHTRYWRDWSSDVCSSDLCSAPKGSSISPNACRTRTSELNLAALAAMPATTDSTCASSLRVYVWPLTGKIGRASCRERSVDLGGRRIIKKKNGVTQNIHYY